MKHPALDLLALAAEEFAFLPAPPLFFGGAVVPLYLGDEDCLDEARVTDDVDLAVEMVGETREGLDIELVRHGFVSDDYPGAPACRWRRGGRRYDVLDAETLPGNDWVRPDRGSYVDHRLGTHSVRALSFWSLLAAKIAAFQDPRRQDAGDSQESEDFHDIVLLLAGNDEFDAWLARPEPALAYVAAWASTHDPDGFRLMAYPHIPRARADELLEGLGERLKRLTELAP